MEKENATGKLKLVHLVYGLIAAAVLVGIVIGRMGNQQEINTKDIKLKVGKEIFQRHEQSQEKQFKAIQLTMDNGFTRIEKQIEKIAK